MNTHDAIALLRRRPYLPWATACLVLTCVAAVLLVTAFHTGPHAPRPDSRDGLAPLGPISTSRARIATGRATPPSVTMSASARSRSAAGAATHASVTTVATAPTASTTPRATSTRASSSTSTRAPATSLPRGAPAAALARSNPRRLTVPAIGISTPVMQLGLNADGTVEVPPLSRNSPAGWYRYSATPGESGSSVMLGHIDSAAYGPSVFFRLAALHPGDEVDVARADGRVAVFRVDRVAQYPKTSFPTQLVYGATAYPSLRLVTCGGRFDAGARSYDDNIVVYATLTASHSGR